MGRSSISNLLIFNHFLNDNISQNTQVVLAYIGFSKVFNTFHRVRLIQRLYNFGFRGKLVAWLASFLTSRTCAVEVRLHSTPVYCVVFINLLKNFKTCLNWKSWKTMPESRNRLRKQTKSWANFPQVSYGLLELEKYIFWWIFISILLRILWQICWLIYKQMSCRIHFLEKRISRRIFSISFLCKVINVFLNILSIQSLREFSSVLKPWTNVKQIIIDISKTIHCCWYIYQSISWKIFLSNHFLSPLTPYWLNLLANPLKNFLANYPTN